MVKARAEAAGEFHVSRGADLRHMTAAAGSVTDKEVTRRVGQHVSD
jgi:hypothetical protein